MVTTYIYLNSTSPRRVEIINKIKKFLPGDIIFDVNKPLFQEDLNKADYKSSRDYLIHNCKLKSCSQTIDACFAKARLAQGNAPVNVIIVSADTILTDKLERRVLEKPVDALDNLNMLQTQIKEGSVKCLSSVHISKYNIDNQTGKIKCVKSDQFVSEAKVVFDKSVLDTEMLKTYVDIGEGLDASGGFKIQENGSFMVKEIIGDYYNVVGLPFNKTLMTLYKYM